MSNDTSNNTIAEDRYSNYRQVYGEELFEKIRNSKILVVGAGGIGCELLKNLVLSGFENIETIDLDTIDVSNLNRQFLFRQHHIGKSKAIIAKESVLLFNPRCNIVAHHGNIKHPNFGPDYFKKFNIAINALDNVDARKHVNRMCLAADITLIDGGTAGYLGQVTTIRKGVTECYECTGKVTQKSFAVCTIRSNPSTIVHCIVWAKLLFERLFGKLDDANAVTDFQEILSNTDPNFNFAEKVFEKVFCKDIEELLGMKNEAVWNAGKPPVTLDFTKVISETNGETTSKQTNALKDQIVWTLSENAKKFVETINSLRDRRNKEQTDLSFDKDDDVALDFVTAAANLRANNFHIENKSRFDVKAVAGNIVPAIATTNAIIAGLIVAEAVKVINDRIQDCRIIHCCRTEIMCKRKPCYIYPVTLSKPNPDCFVCSSNFVTLVINTQSKTLGNFVNDVLIKNLGLQEPMISVGSALVYECGSDIVGAEKVRQDAQLKKQLKDCGIVHNATVNVEDFSQEINWKVVIVDDPTVEDFEVHGKSGKPKEKKKVQEETTSTTATIAKNGSLGLKGVKEHENGVIEIDDIIEEEEQSKKRSRPEQNGNGIEEPATKKQKKQEDEDIILLDD